METPWNTRGIFTTIKTYFFFYPSKKQCTVLPMGTQTPASCPLWHHILRARQCFASGQWVGKSRERFYEQGLAVDSSVHARSHGHIYLTVQLTQVIWLPARKKQADLRRGWSAYWVTHAEMTFERGRDVTAHQIHLQNSRLFFKRKRKAQSISSVSYQAPHLWNHGVLLPSEAAVTPLRGL